MSKKMLVCGCSFTFGNGLEGENNDPRLWCNQLANKLGYSLTNIAENGRNNDWIFVETALEQSKNYYDLIIVAWSAMPRFNYNLGFELYTTMSNFSGQYSIGTNPENYDEKWQRNVGDKLLRAYNFHWDFLKLVKYINILKKQCGSKIYFVNALGPWSDNFFTKKDIEMPSELDDFTQQLLHTNNRDDKEILELYNKMHEMYTNAGGINEELWVNLYNNFRTMMVDRGNDGEHPGYLSHDLFTEMLYKRLTSIKTMLY